VAGLISIPRVQQIGGGPGEENWKERNLSEQRRPDLTCKF
jgi:hypothetical protein